MPPENPNAFTPNARPRSGSDRNRQRRRDRNEPGAAPDVSTTASADAGNRPDTSQSNSDEKKKHVRKAWEQDVGKTERDHSVFTQEFEEVEKGATLKAHREKIRAEGEKKRETFLAEVEEYEHRVETWQEELDKEEKKGDAANTKKIELLQRRIEKADLFIRFRDIMLEIESTTADLVEKEKERIHVANELATLTRDQDAESTKHLQKEQELEEQKRFEEDLAAQLEADPLNIEKFQQLEDLRRNIANNQAELDRLQERVGAHPASVQALEDAWNALGNQTQQLDRHLQELRDRGATLRMQIRLDPTDLNEPLHRVDLDPPLRLGRTETPAWKAGLRKTGRFLADDANQLSRVAGGVGRFGWESVKDFGAAFMQYVSKPDAWFHNPFKRAKSNIKSGEKKK